MTSLTHAGSRAATLLIALALTSVATRPQAVATAPPAPMLLWPSGAPGAIGNSDADKPAITPYLPGATSTGAAVVVVPGGGFTTLNANTDGAEVAAWLNSRGIAAFVLRYRLQPRYQMDAAIADANRAVHYVRAHAAEFKIAASRVGVMGFGAGARLAADAAYNHALAGDAGAADPVDRVPSTPNFVALIYGSAPLAQNVAVPPPTFLVASSSQADNQDGAIDLWTRLRAVRAPVDAHFFAKADASLGLAKNDPAVGAWPDSFYAWVRYRGFLTDQPRLALKGMAYLDGRPLPHGYLILTPLDAVGAGPIVCRVLNSTAGVPIGEFTVPATQGPIPGRYRVDVHQNANRWLSNAFTPFVTSDSAFGHSRNLSPSIDDHHVYSKVHPADKDEYTVTIPAAGDANMRIEVFTK